MSHRSGEQEQVKTESAMMIPDCRQRLESALSELHTAVEDAKRDADGVEEEQREAAMEVMAAAEKVFE